MARFVWKGKTRSGEAQRGVIAARSKEEAEVLLRQRQITVTSLREEGKEFSIPSIGGGVKEKDVAIFTRQFSVMIDAGLPLIQCLEILGSQQKNKNFANMINQTRADVESGATLSDSMRKHPKAFDQLYTNMVAAGEAGGILDQILERLSIYIEKAVKLKAQVKSALIYPVVICLVAIGIVVLIMYKVIPTFEAMFKSSGQELPGMTRVTLEASRFTQNYLIFIIVAMVLIFIALRQYHLTYHGRRVVDKVMLKIPVLGGLLQKISIARFCRTLSTLISSGVPILDGIEITAKTSGNAIVEDSLMIVRKDIEEGKTIAEPLSKLPLFPPMVVSMIGVGETTGAIDVMLSKIADFYEDEVDVAVAGLMSLLEPILIIFLGTVIGFIVISLYLPIFKLATTIG
ncbi:MAG: type II secretion system F family protein [Acidobacteria bacterium]|nr:type II secretion system F family protein [Acidobacteriota bacterium]